MREHRTYEGSRTPRRGDRGGYLYAFHCPANGLTKIGRTGDVDGRRAVIERELGRAVDVVMLWQFQIEADLIEAEAAVHEFLGDWRTHGEWFSISIERDIETTTIYLEELLGYRLAGRAALPVNKSVDNSV